MTRETFAEILSILEATHRIGFSLEEREIWWALLRGLPDAAAKAATLDVCRRSSYPPKPAHIVNAVLGHPPNAADDRDRLDDEAEAAIRWLEANLSEYDPVNLRPELNALVRSMGGPVAIVEEIARGDWRFRRGEAQRLYKRFRRDGVPPGMAVPEWPDRPHRIEGSEDIPQIQQRVFERPGLPALPLPALPDGESALEP